MNQKSSSVEVSILTQDAVLALNIGKIRTDLEDTPSSTNNSDIQSQYGAFGIKMWLHSLRVCVCVSFLRFFSFCAYLRVL